MSELRVSTRPTAMVVALRGEIDCLTAGAIQDAAQRAVDDGVARLELDLRDVTFMDSQGLNALMAAQRMLRSEGIGLALSGTPRCVRTVLEVTGVDTMLTIG